MTLLPGTAFLHINGALKLQIFQKRKKYGTFLTFLQRVLEMMSVTVPWNTSTDNGEMMWINYSHSFTTNKIVNKHAPIIPAQSKAAFYTLDNKKNKSFN